MSLIHTLRSVIIRKFKNLFQAFLSLKPKLLLGCNPILVRPHQLVIANGHIQHLTALFVIIDIILNAAPVFRLNPFTVGWVCV